MGAKQEGPASEPNVVPLIDVLLVLIIIFMVITPSVPTGLPALIPQPSPSPNRATTEPYTVVVRVMDNGELMINQEPCDWDALGGRVFNIFKKRADKVAFVGGADDVPFAEVARAIDIMRTAGVGRVGLITRSTISEE